jgi:hypothetical protein
MMPLKWLTISVVLMAFAIMIWASDRISYEGERTVYSVRCEQGVWEGWRCTGHLAAGDRYRFRASRARQEVFYWIVGSSAPSGKYTSCKVVDRGNWTCAEAIDQIPTITHQMVNGRPTRDDGAATLPIHAVSKWQWWLLDVGFHVTMNASY